MFDTVVFQKSIVCKCGKKLESTQVKHFDNILNVYKTGDIVQGAPVFAVLIDSTYCDNCEYRGDIYITIAYGLYLGVFESYVDAKRKMEDFSMEDILKFYNTFQTKTVNHHNADKVFMVNLIDYFENSKSDMEPHFSMFSEYFKDTQTPLEAVKNYLQKDKIKDAIVQAYDEKCEFDISYEMQEGYAIIHNPIIEKLLSSKYLFKLVQLKYEDGSIGEESMLETHGELNENTILDRVQEWLDVRGLRLQVILTL